MKRTLVLVTTLFLLSCASQQLTREQTLVNKALDAMGGADKTDRAAERLREGHAASNGSPSSPRCPAARCASPTSRASTSCRTARAARRAPTSSGASPIPTPRTFKFSEIVTPDAGYVLGIDTTAATRKA